MSKYYFAIDFLDKEQANVRIKTVHREDCSEILGRDDKHGPYSTLSSALAEAKKYYKNDPVRQCEICIK